jgi:hypothetical protein
MLLALLAAFVVAPAVGAQDMMEGGVVCDGDLVLSLYVAEYYFGYGAVHDMMMAGDDAAMMVDISKIDKGQFAPLFDSMMGMMDENMMMPGGIMTPEDTQAIMDSMSMMMGAEMMDESGEMTTLAPLAVEGEAAECAALRSELHYFYAALAEHNMMMSESM